MSNERPDPTLGGVGDPDNRFIPPRVGWNSGVKCGVAIGVEATPERGAAVSEDLSAKKQSALNRVKTVRGHLDGIIRMLEDDAYCVDVMKQLSATQSSLERANRIMLHNHLETCFSEAVLAGRGQPAIDELVESVKFNPALTGPQAQLSGAAVGEDGAGDDDDSAAEGSVA